MQRECQCHRLGAAVRVCERLRLLMPILIHFQMWSASAAQSSKKLWAHRWWCVSHYHHVFTTHRGLLTVAAECLTALQAVCRISAALPGFSRFLVNLRVDSAAISSSERPRSSIQPGCVCRSQSCPSLLTWADRAVFTHTHTHIHTLFTHTHFTHSPHKPRAEDACVLRFTTVNQIYRFRLRFSK